MVREQQQWQRQRQRQRLWLRQWQQQKRTTRPTAGSRGGLARSGQQPFPGATCTAAAAAERHKGQRRRRWAAALLLHDDSGTDRRRRRRRRRRSDRVRAINGALVTRREVPGRLRGQVGVPSAAGRTRSRLAGIGGSVGRMSDCRVRPAPTHADGTGRGRESGWRQRRQSAARSAAVRRERRDWGRSSVADVRCLCGGGERGTRGRAYAGAASHAASQNASRASRADVWMWTVGMGAEKEKRSLPSRGFLGFLGVAAQAGRIGGCSTGCVRVDLGR